MELYALLEASPNYFTLLASQLNQFAFKSFVTNDQLNYETVGAD